jgi:hypothetical protein
MARQIFLKLERIQFLKKVGVTGIGPATSRSQSERSTDELHPDR